MIRIKLTFLSFMLLATLSANAQAADDFWNTTVPDSDFSVGTNWSLGTFPTASDIGRIDNGAIVDVLTAPAAMGQLWIGSTLPGSVTPGSGTLNQSNFTLTANDYVEVGQGATLTNNTAGGTGWLNLSGSAVFTHSGLGWMNIGENPDSGAAAQTTGYVNLSGSAILNNTAGRFVLGRGASGKGYLTISDTATLNLGNDFHYIGFISGTGTVTMNGGTVNNTSGGWLLVGGYQGTGTWNHFGGTINSTSNPLTLGDGAGSTGNFYLNGGVVNTSGVVAGIGWDAGNATGNFYFNGGELRASTSSTNFMGMAIGTASNPGTLNVYISAGGAKINTNGYNVTIPFSTSFFEDSLSPGGGLTKLGAGTLTLNNGNYYTGNTLVNAGTLLVNTQIFSPTITVASGATLGGSAILQHVVVQAPVAGVRGTLIPGDGVSSYTTQMSNLDITSAQLKFLIHQTYNSGLIDVSTGTVNVSTSAGLLNQITLYQNPAVAAETTEGYYTLIKCKTLNYLTGGDVLANFDLPNKYLGDWDASIGQRADIGDPTLTDIYVHLVPSSNQWLAPKSPSSNFLYSNTANWVTGATVGVPNAQGAKALFADAGTPPTVTLDMNVTLGKLVFKNASSPGYTISPTGRNHFIMDAGAGVPAEVDDLLGNHVIKAPITLNKETNFVVSGAGDTLTVDGIISGSSIPPLTVTKDGPGTLLLSANNTYDGATAVIGGTLQLNGTNSYTGATTATNGTVVATVIADAGVASSIGIPATTSASNLVLDASTLKYIGAAAASTNRGITLANASAIDTARNLSINGPVVSGTALGPNVTLGTPGAGTITLGGQITSTGTFTKTGAGTLTYASTAAGVVSTIANSGGAAYVIQNGNVIIAGTDNTTQYNVSNGELSVGAEAINNTIGLSISAGTVNVGSTFSLGAGNLGTSTLTMTGGAIKAVSAWLGYSTATFYPGTQNVNLSGNSSLSASGTDFWIGQTTGSNTIVSIIGNAQMSSGGYMSIGLFGTSTVTVNGAGANLSSTTDLNVGDQPTASGTLILQNGTVQTATLWVCRNSGSTGAVNQSGGAVTATGDFRIGENSNGIYTQTGGAVSAGYCRVGYGTTGVGSYNITGGSATFTGIEADLGANGSGTLSVGSTPTTSGSVNLPVLYLGRSYWADGLGADEGGSGNLVVSGTGSVTVNGTIIGSSLATDTGQAHVTLNGGTLTVNGIGKAAGGAGGLMDIVFNGGVLKAGASSTSFLTGLDSAKVRVGGAIINTNTFNVTVNQILAADAGSPGGGLTKQGSGTLTIAQNATYTGNTTVSTGILDMLNINTPTATVSVGAGAELTANSVVANTLTIGAGGTVVIKALPGGPMAPSSLSPVPEPGTLVLLATAALAAAFAAWRRK